MLRTLKGLIGYWIRATDGNHGSVNDFLIVSGDDRNWRLKWMVADVGGLILRKRVLLPIQALGGADETRGRLEVKLSGRQIEESLDARLDPPIARQMKARYLEHYGNPYFWILDGVWGHGGSVSGTEGEPSTISKLPRSPEEAAPFFSRPPAERDSRLLSLKSVAGYGIEALDGRFGHVRDIVADDENWSVRFLVVKVRNILPSRSVLIPVRYASSVSWQLGKVRVDLPREKLAHCPAFHPEDLQDARHLELFQEYYKKAG